MQDLGIKYPMTDKTQYPETQQTCYYGVTFVASKDGSNNQVYTVTVTTLPGQPTDPPLNINDFGQHGPI